MVFEESCERYMHREGKSLLWCALLECESPIERSLFLALLLVGHDRFTQLSMGSPQGNQIGAYLHPRGSTGYDSSLPLLVITPQMPMGDYRIDFLVTLVDKENRFSIAVECDGHDFHERTKEQAQRDRRKDRLLQSSGMKVFRFTGSEIFTDVFACAEQVISELENSWRQEMRRLHPQIYSQEAQCR